MKHMQKIQSITNHELALARYDWYKSFSKGSEIIGTEKLDGANASFDLDGNIYSHKQKLSETNTLRGFYNYVLDNKLVELFKKLLPNNETDSIKYQIFGEWLVPHPTIQYREDRLRKFYLFDIWAEDDNQLSDDTTHGSWMGIRFVYDFFYNYYYDLTNHGVDVPTQICDFNLENLNQLNDLAERNKTNSLYSIDGRMEGIVFTSLNDNSANGSPIRIKVVNQEYKETKAKGTKEQHLSESEIWLEQYLTDARAQKLLNKEIDENGLVINRQIFKTDFPKKFRDKLWQDILEESVDTPSQTSLNQSMKTLLRRVGKVASRNIGIRLKFTEEEH